MRVRSRARRPSSGRACRGSSGQACGAASPMHVISTSGSDATAACCGWRSHSSKLRSVATTSPACAAAFSNSSADQPASAADIESLRLRPARQAQKPEDAIAVVLEVGVQANEAAPSARAAGIDAGEPIPDLGSAVADRERAAAFESRFAHVDRDVLGQAVAAPADLGGGERRRAERGRAAVPTANDEGEAGSTPERRRWPRLASGSPASSSDSAGRVGCRNCHVRQYAGVRIACRGETYPCEPPRYAALTAGSFRSLSVGPCTEMRPFSST